MVIELLVMRHAKSAWDTGDDDFDRPLNSRGARDALRMARWLAENDLIPDRVLSSPAVRARATALAVVAEGGVARALVDFDRELYHADVDTWLAALWRTPPTTHRLLICGHNPGLDDLVDELSLEPPELSASGKLMTTAAIAHLLFDTGWPDVGSRSGRLVSLTRPGEL